MVEFMMVDAEGMAILSQNVLPSDPTSSSESLRLLRRNSNTTASPRSLRPTTTTTLGNSSIRSSVNSSPRRSRGAVDWMDLDMSVHSLDNYGGGGSVCGGSISGNTTGMTWNDIRTSVQAAIQMDKEEALLQQQQSLHTGDSGKNATAKETLSLERQARRLKIRTLAETANSVHSTSSRSLQSLHSVRSTRSSTQTPRAKRSSQKRSSDASAAVAAPRTPSTSSRRKLSLRSSSSSFGASVPKSPARLHQHLRRQAARRRNSHTFGGGDDGSIASIGSASIRSSRSTGTAATATSRRRRVPRRPRSPTAAASPSLTVRSSMTSSSQSSPYANKSPRHKARKRNSSTIFQVPLTAQDEQQSMPFQVIAASCCAPPKTKAAAAALGRSLPQLTIPNLGTTTTAMGRHRASASHPRRRSAAMAGIPTTTTAKPKSIHCPFRRATRRMTISSSSSLASSSPHATAKSPSTPSALKQQCSLLFQHDNNHHPSRSRRNASQSASNIVSDMEDDDDDMRDIWNPYAPRRTIDKKSKYKRLLATTTTTTSNPDKKKDSSKNKGHKEAVASTQTQPSSAAKDRHKAARERCRKEAQKMQASSSSSILLFSHSSRVAASSATTPRRQGRSPPNDSNQRTLRDDAAKEQSAMMVVANNTWSSDEEDLYVEDDAVVVVPTTLMNEAVIMDTASNSTLNAMVVADIMVQDEVGLCDVIVGGNDTTFVKENCRNGVQSTQQLKVPTEKVVTGVDTMLVAPENLPVTSESEDASVQEVVQTNSASQTQGDGPLDPMKAKGMSTVVGVVEEMEEEIVTHETSMIDILPASAEIGGDTLLAQTIAETEAIPTAESPSQLSAAEQSADGHIISDALLLSMTGGRGDDPTSDMSEESTNASQEGCRHQKVGSVGEYMVLPCLPAASYVVAPGPIASVSTTCMAISEEMQSMEAPTEPSIEGMQDLAGIVIVAKATAPDDGNLSLPGNENLGSQFPEASLTESANVEEIMERRLSDKTPLVSMATRGALGTQQKSEPPSTDMLVPANEMSGVSHSEQPTAHVGTSKFDATGDLLGAKQTEIKTTETLKSMSENAAIPPPPPETQTECPGTPKRTNVSAKGMEVGMIRIAIRGGSLRRAGDSTDKKRRTKQKSRPMSSRERSHRSADGNSRFETRKKKRMKKPETSSFLEEVAAMMNAKGPPPASSKKKSREVGDGVTSIEEVRRRWERTRSSAAMSSSTHSTATGKRRSERRKPSSAMSSSTHSTATKRSERRTPSSAVSSSTHFTATSSRTKEQRSSRRRPSSSASVSSKAGKVRPSPTGKRRPSTSSMPRSAQAPERVHRAPEVKTEPKTIANETVAPREEIAVSLADGARSCMYSAPSEILDDDANHVHFSGANPQTPSHSQSSHTSVGTSE